MVNRYSNPLPKVALVTGANGITGYAIIENLIRRPETEW
jgi:NAD(P)-dependent dehydrogenase (short-subunit alcohol dehydrogenase family)